MAYKTEIQIGVRGSAGVEKLRKEVDQLNEKLTKIQNTTKVGVLSISRYDAALAKAADSLRKVQIATKDENIAIKQYVTALRSSNAVQERQNRLIAQEITLRERAARIKALPKATPTTQFDSPIGPGPASPISSRPKPGRTGLERFGEFGLGAGFPLLFGGGAGQVLGGAFGTAIGGGGPAGFGLQIAFSAIGGQVEAAIGRIAEMDGALQELDMDALADSTIVVNAELRQAVQNLVDLGENQKAVELATAEVSMQTGVLPESIKDASNAVTVLSNVWDEFVARVSGLVALVGTPLLGVLSAVLKVVSEIVKPVNFVLSLLLKSGNNLEGINEAEEKRLAKLKQTGAELEKELGREKEIFAIEQRRVAGTTAAAKLNNSQVSRDLDLAKLRQATEDKILAKRREFAGVTDHVGEVERDYQIVLINQSAEIERQRILKKYSLDETAAGLQREKELRKQIFETRVQESKIAQAGVQAQLNQIANEEKIFQIRQQTAAATVELERARFDAQLSTLQLQEAGLQRELEGLQKKEFNLQRQLDIIDAIAENQIRQAEIQNEVAKLQNVQGIAQAKIAQQQIQFEVQRIKLQLQMVQLKAQEIKDDEQRAAKIREIAATEQQVLALTKEMVSAGNKRLETAIKIARQKDIVADNILKGKLQSIEAERVEARRAARAAQLAKATGEAADEAARLNRNMSKGSGGLGSKTTQTMSTSLPIDPDVQKAVEERAGPFGYRNVSELINKLEEAQKIKNARTAREAKMSQPSSSSFASSSAYGAKSSSGSRSGTATVNVKTGPVMQVENKRYVSMEDFESGLREVARSTAQTSRSYGSRRYSGIGS